jgi:hypothetical protein
MIQNDEGRN